MDGRLGSGMSTGRHLLVWRCDVRVTLLTDASVPVLVLMGSVLGSVHVASRLGTLALATGQKGSQSRKKMNKKTTQKAEEQRSYRHTHTLIQTHTHILIHTHTL